MAVVVVVLAALVGALIVFRPASDATPPAPPLAGSDLRWTDVAGQPVPVSAAHGPLNRSNGLASGFTHDGPGAVLAALHIQSRLAAEAGPEVYESTAQRQCFGDIDNTLRAIRSSASTAAAGSATPTAYFYRIVSGDPAGGRVLVSVAAQTSQARANGGFVSVERALEWRDGDWKMELPPTRPQIIAVVDSYIPLGEPN